MCLTYSVYWHVLWDFFMVIHFWNTTTKCTFLLRTTTSEPLLDKRDWRVLCRQEPLTLDLFMLSSHLYFYFIDHLLYVSRLLLITVRTQVPSTTLARLLAGVVTERDTWSLWSVSQQQTVHTSQQYLGIVAHFRTSVHDTVSVVTLSSLVPHH